MDDKEKRLRSIIDETRALFASGLREKAAEAADWVGRWREGDVSDEVLIERLYRITHNLKGVALTLGFDEVHDIAEKVAEFKRRQEREPAESKEMAELAESVLRLASIRIDD
ncbi:Hpt domain-containing protein [Paenibacillus thermotolerans]|uniref:Hpt domain-containing protein n=1 Tax=Paenibacillus thermotolerans TaxID=3027807 RepID=UPI0023686D9A|nr:MULTISPECIES: Hpt domain-containing protein [unclassified Paenibacillus]